MIGKERHINDKVVVAEGCTAFGDSQVRVACFFHFFNDILHVFRSHELALLHIDRYACLGCAVNKVGLAAEECRDLDHVQDLGCFFKLGDVMDVGENRHLQFLLDGCEDFKSLIETRSAEGIEEGTVCLVIRGFENVLDAEAFADFLDFTADHQCAVISFNDAGTCDQEKLASVNGQISYLNGFHWWLLSNKRFAFFKSSSVSMPMSSESMRMTPIL